MSKLPDNHIWVKFKHKEWLTYGAFQKLTRTVRCYWVDLFSLSYSCDEIGQLQINGKPLTNQEIAKSISSSKREFESALKKLIDVGLCKISSNGTIIIPQVLELYDENNLRKNSNNAAKSLRNPCEITKGNDGNQQKTPTQEKEEDKDKDIREDKKEIPQTPFETKEPSQPEPVKTEQEELQEATHLLSQISGIKIEHCEVHTQKWLKELNGNIPLLLHCMDQGVGGTFPINYTRFIVQKYAKNGKAPIAVLKTKTNKERMTEEMGLCKNLAEFEAMYPQEEIPDYSSTRAFGKGY